MRYIFPQLHRVHHRKKVSGSPSDGCQGKPETTGEQAHLAPQAVATASAGSGFSEAMRGSQLQKYRLLEGLVNVHFFFTSPKYWGYNLQQIHFQVMFKIPKPWDINQTLTKL
jgi:hypothetical protein